MHRGPARAFGLLLASVLFLCPGCATALLWDWAADESVAGELLGVFPDVRGDTVLYRFEPTGEFTGGIVGLRIAPGWPGLPMQSLVTTPAGDALALRTPFVPVADPRLSTAASPRFLRRIDYRKTLGRQVVSFSSEEGPYGFVELANDRGEVFHELYGYDGQRGQWVRLATVDLGSYRASSARLSAGIVLTPVTLALDLAVIAAIVCAIGSGGGGSLSGLDVPSLGGGDGPEPVRFSERMRYWQSLTTAASPGLR